MNTLKLHAPYQPMGDQPKAIKILSAGFRNNKKFQTLLGATGTGKTFTAANVINEIKKPTLFIAHNKTLAAQLASELREFFPDNAVHYFVSYYDYYQPEAYIANTDTYIEKDALINEEIDKLRHAATQDLLTRDDVIIVSSVSCIYGIGDKDLYREMAITLKKGEKYPRQKLIKMLIERRYARAKSDFKPATFEVIGDVLEIYPPGVNYALQLQFWDDDLEEIKQTDPFTGEIQKDKLSEVTIFPAKHYIIAPEMIKKVIPKIRKDLTIQYDKFIKEGKLLEAERLKTKVEYDLEMLNETGYTNGIENYSRYFSERKIGEPPSTLIDFFPPDFTMFIDESHITISQIGAMYNGDRSRKENLVNHGFRLPSAFDNRPLTGAEFEQKIAQVCYISATPNQYEIDKSGGITAEQIIRPTGLLDPIIDIKPSTNQVDDLLVEIKKCTKNKQRTLITTLTKKSSEQLSEYLADNGIRVQYLHSEIDTIERIEILRNLRLGLTDVIVGINLLREGLDLPEVALIAVLDADKEGFLRSATALIQTIGRAARNVDGRVILYADKITNSMKKAIDETNRRRIKQDIYNHKNNITPVSIIKEIKDIAPIKTKKKPKKMSVPDTKKLIIKLEFEMDIYSANQEYEQALEVRDEIARLKKSIKK